MADQPHDDEATHRITVEQGHPVSKVDNFPLWVPASVSPQATSLAVLLTASTIKTFGDYSVDFTYGFMQWWIGADSQEQLQAALDELISIGFVTIEDTEHGRFFTMRSRPSLDFRGPRDLSEAYAVYCASREVR